MDRGTTAPIQKHVSKIIKDFQHNVYKGGLILEEEEVKQGDIMKLTFAGSDITVSRTPCFEIVAENHNKNWEHLTLTGKQKLPRYPHSNSYVSKNYKLGTATGNI